MNFLEIQSVQNPLLKKIEQLIKNPQKYPENWLLEGVHLVQEGLKNVSTTATIQILIGQECIHHQEVKEIQESINLINSINKNINIKFYQIPSRLFQEYSSVKPQVLMLFPAELDIQKKSNFGLSNHHVVLDGIQDPGNLGTILRTAAAVGIQNIHCLKGTTYPFAPKVLRAAMGAHFHLQIKTGIEHQELLQYQHQEIQNIHALTLTNSTSLYDLELIDSEKSENSQNNNINYYWIFGNEGAGIDVERLKNPLLKHISIPQSSVVESLNVGVACSVVLYELLRKRLKN